MALSLKQAEKKKKKVAPKKVLKKMKSQISNDENAETVSMKEKIESPWQTPPPQAIWENWRNQLSHQLNEKLGLPDKEWNWKEVERELINLVIYLKSEAETQLRHKKWRIPLPSFLNRKSDL
jgi:hypothetical protein